jgi:insertion element IS1 protein InsB
VAFYAEKKRKLWIWIAIERYTQEVLGFSVGSRGKKAFKSLLNQIEKYPVTHYATDEWKLYERLLENKHLTGKKHTTQIESLNANVRHCLARFRRRTRCYSKYPIMVELSLFLLFHKNLISILF